MKIRKGFVSNSSSSSFVVTFPKKPETKEELAGMMGECHPTTQWGDKAITSEDVVDYIWKYHINNESTERYPYDYSREHIANDLFEEIERNWIVEDTIEMMDFETTQKVKEKFGEIVDLLFPEPTENGAHRMPITLSDDCGSFEASLMCGDIFRNTDYKCTGRR